MITFDTDRRHIVLDSTYVSWAEIWSRWVDFHEKNRQYPLALSLVGGQSLGSGLYIPPYFFLLNNWRVRPMEADHDLTLVGNGFVQGGGIPVTSTLGVYRINVNYTVPVQAQGIAVNGSSIDSGDIAAIADEVMVRMVAKNYLTVAKFLGLK